MIIKAPILETPDALKRIATDTEYARNQIIEIVYASFRYRDIGNFYKRNCPFEWEFTIGGGKPHETHISLSAIGLVINIHGSPHVSYSMMLSNAELLQLNDLCEQYSVCNESNISRSVLDHLLNSPFARGIKIDEVLREMEEEEAIA